MYTKDLRKITSGDQEMTHTSIKEGGLKARLQLISDDMKRSPSRVSHEEFKKYYLTDTVTPKFKAPFGEKFMRQNIELFR